MTSLPPLSFQSIFHTATGKRLPKQRQNLSPPLLKIREICSLGGLTHGPPDLPLSSARPPNLRSLVCSPGHSQHFLSFAYTIPSGSNVLPCRSPLSEVTLQSWVPSLMKPPSISSRLSRPLLWGQWAWPCCVACPLTGSTGSIALRHDWPSSHSFPHGHRKVFQKQHGKWNYNRLNVGREGNGTIFH